jgi:NADPH2:quinone reductase
VKHTCIIVTHYGGPEALQVREEECPEPQGGEVRVRVLAAGVSLPDLLMREGVHPETPRLPFTPGWDLVGVVDRLGDGIAGLEPGQRVAALPISGAYAEFVCLPQRELVPVPSGLDAAEAVSLVLNYVTAYQMLHRSAKVRPGQRVLIHGAAGGVGSALLQLGRLAGLEMYGTCSSRGAAAVSDLGAIPIGYQQLDGAEGQCTITHHGVGPQRGKHLGLAHYLPGMLDQVAQHRKRLLRQRNRPFSPPQPRGVAVHGVAIKANLPRRLHFRPRVRLLHIS